MTDSKEYKRQDLRPGVDYVGVAACFVVHDGKGKFVLHKRSQNCRDEQGVWDNGGGVVEFNESIPDAIRREVKEELSAESQDMTFLDWYEVTRTLNNKPTHWIAFSYAVKVDPTRVKNGYPHKIEDIGWFTLESLPSPLHSQTMRDLEAARNAGII